LAPLTSSHASYQIVDEVNQYNETATSVGNIYAATLGCRFILSLSMGNLP